MNIESWKDFTPTPSIYSMDNNRAMRSHSELNAPLLVEEFNFSKRQHSGSKTPDEFDLPQVIVCLDQFSKTEVARWESAKKIVKLQYHKRPNDIELLSDNNKWIFDRKPIEDLRNKICNIYNERQDENWDGYRAEPLEFLSQSLEFADSLFSESRLLVESVDIVPENDGCLCFEWYKSDEKFISVSVKDETLIYNYEIAGAKGCGETNFFGKKDIIEKIKRVV